MSNNAPDFSSTFDIAEDNLADAERQLRERRQAKKRREHEADSNTNDTEATADDPMSEECPKPRRQNVAAKLPSKKKEEGTFTHELVKKELRRNLTLKVLEENEARFNRLFHQLQLAGDARKKQDLADEALSLLFAKYKKVAA